MDCVLSFNLCPFNEHYFLLGYDQFDDQDPFGSYAGKSYGGKLGQFYFYYLFWLDTNL